MKTIVEKALVLWGMADAKTVLIAARENAVFKVEASCGTFALRLHRKGYRSDQELRSELMWMDAVSSHGISVPKPTKSTTGALLHDVQGTQVDVLSWLSGTTLDVALETRNAEKRQKHFRDLGREMAKLHLASDAWTPPNDFKRSSWDRKGLVGEQPLWDQFWNNPELTSSEKLLFLKVREKADAELASLEPTLDYGLIHADLVTANVMVENGQLHLIDFDDGGYGFRLFELATGLLKNLDASDYPTLCRALIEGYTAERPLDTDGLDLFILLRALTYVGWNIARMDEDPERNRRFIDVAKQLATSYL